MHKKSPGSPEAFKFIKLPEALPSLKLRQTMPEAKDQRLTTNDYFTVSIWQIKSTTLLE
jgi:hypothetical protein